MAAQMMTNYSTTRIRIRVWLVLALPGNPVPHAEQNHGHNRREHDDESISGNGKRSQT